jgi:hypothetical protein
MPDLAVAKNEAHALGRAIKEQSPSLTRKQQVGLRMMSQGRFADLHRYGLHNDPEIKRIANMATSKMGILRAGSEAMAQAGSKASSLESKLPASLRGHVDKIKNMSLADVPQALSDAKDHIHGDAMKRVSELWGG